ncbi:hypothetical protein PBK173_000317000 [Plasmodium berghei]|nr:hypothetical protein PBK173_000317000 [Plasmodium berghei]
MTNDDYLYKYASNKKKNKLKFLDEEDIVKDNNSLSSSDDKKKKKKKKKKIEKAEKNKDQFNNFEDVDITKCKNNPTNITTNDNSKNFKCQICNQTFDSRNKLFEHIKAEGHMANQIYVTPSKTKKKKKKENK